MLQYIVLQLNFKMMHPCCAITHTNTHTHTHTHTYIYIYTHTLYKKLIRQHVSASLKSRPDDGLKDELQKVA